VADLYKTPARDYVQYIIIAAWALSFLSLCYVPPARGMPASTSSQYTEYATSPGYEWIIPGAYGSWENVNVTTLAGAPAGSILEVWLCNQFQTGAGISGVRERGSALNRYLTISGDGGVSGGTSQAVHTHVKVGTGANAGMIEVYASTTYMIPALLGWWTGVDYVELYSNISSALQYDSTWTDYNATAGVGVPINKTLNVACMSIDQTDEAVVGVRAANSSLDRRHIKAEAQGGEIGYGQYVWVNGSGYIQHWSSSWSGDTERLYVLGYFDGTDNGGELVFTELHSSFTLGLNLAWNDLDATSYLPAAAQGTGTTALIFTMHNDEWYTNSHGIRENGGAFDRWREHARTFDSSTNSWKIFEFLVNLDSSDIFEEYHERGGGVAQVWIEGFFTETEAPPAEPFITAGMISAGLLVSGLLTFFLPLGFIAYARNMKAQTLIMLFMVMVTGLALLIAFANI